MRAHVSATVAHVLLQWLIYTTPSVYASGTSVFFQDTGALGEDTSIISRSGKFSRHGSSTSPDIANTLHQEQFRTHRWGSDFTYTISGLIPNASYQVQVGLAEVWEPNCVGGKRQFDILVNDVIVKELLDVYATVGCRTALVETYQANASTSGEVRVGFLAKVENAMVSSIEILESNDDDGGNGKEESWRDVNESDDYVARHECSFVQAGTKFYMFGGRESPWRLDTYDYSNNEWKRSANVPQTLNHFQAVEYQGLVWVVGAFKDNKFPSERPAARVYVYDPALDVWILGPQVPEDRRRGGGGLVVYNDKFYLVAGNTNGHTAGYVSYFDEYDPRTASWKQLSDAPNARDHFHAAVVGDRLYAAGGRRTSKLDTFNDTVAKVDVYDFTSGQWLPDNSVDDLPVPRAGAATAVLGDRVIVMGGESGIQEEAHTEVHALDTATGTWESLPPLNHGRHGTQAIVSGQGVYVAGGSPVRGGGNQRNMEEMSKAAGTFPSGVQCTAGVLSAPSSIEIPVDNPKILTIQHVDGNQGVFVHLVMLEGDAATDFRISSNAQDRHLIGRGEQHDVLVEYTGSTNGATAELVLGYSMSEEVRIELVASVPSATVPTSDTTTTTTTTRTESPSSTHVVELQQVYFVNAGVIGEDTSIVSGERKQWGAVVEIDNTESPTLYQTHRYGRTFAYTFGNLAPGMTYQVSMGFAEIYTPNCQPNKRRFDVIINGLIVRPDLDVFSSVGCKTALVEAFDVVANEDGEIVVGFQNRVENAMVSFLEISEIVTVIQETITNDATTAATAISTTATSNVPVISRQVTINAGAQGENTLLLTGTSRGYSSKSSIVIQQGNTDALDNISPQIFTSHRWGTNFGYVVDGFAPLQPLFVTLGFAETYEPNCLPFKRIMNVLVNGKVIVSNLDVYSRAQGCFTPHLEVFTINAHHDGSLQLEFQQKEQNAMISYIYVSTDP